MRWALPVGIVGYCALALASAAEARPPLGDPVALNIGINCQWQQSCMKAQAKAMKRALKLVDKSQPPAWRVQMCNRNAGRQRARVDWVGFDNCMRNTALRPVPARAIKVPPRLPKASARAPRRNVRRTVPAAPAAVATAPGPGERG